MQARLVPKRLFGKLHHLTRMPDHLHQRLAKTVMTRSGGPADLQLFQQQFAVADDVIQRCAQRVP